MPVLRRHLVGLLALALTACAFAETPAIGAAAPDFKLTTLDGKAFSLSEAAKAQKAVVLMWISTQCPYSNAYNAQMKDLASAYSSKGVLFVGINSNKTEDLEKAKSHAKSNGHTFPIVKDLENKVADMFGAQRTPEVFVVDSEGKIRYHGRITADHEDPKSSPDLKNALDEMLAGKPVARSETKAFGCTIKRV
jgi:peroxiredoxin